MAFKRIEIHKNINLQSRKEGFRKIAPNDKEYQNVMEFLRLLTLGEINGKPIGENRQRKILDMFLIFFKNYDKPTSQTTLEDLRQFKEKLSNNKIKKENGDNYSEETKADLTETIVRYFEYQYPDKLSKWIKENKHSKMPLRKWFVIKPDKRTPEALSEAEVERLYKACKNATERFLIAVLFDSGARAGEFLNIRFEDVQEPTADFPYYKIDLKEEYSKTEGRVIGLYWKYSTDAIKEYLAECDKTDKTKQVFPHDYDNVRGFLRRIGMRALKRAVHFHLFRKTSATFYAGKLKNRQQLCYRYGWEFSSEMPDVYIKRAGLVEDEVKDRMLNTSLEILQKENQELKTQFGLMKESSSKELDSLKKQMDENEKKHIDEVFAMNMMALWKSGVLTKKQYLEAIEYKTAS